jgi:hypothetical protein
MQSARAESESPRVVTAKVVLAVNSGLVTTEATPRERTTEGALSDTNRGTSIMSFKKGKSCDVGYNL